MVPFYQTSKRDIVDLNKMRSNQRKTERHGVEAFVKVRGRSHEYVFRTRDLSSSGLFLYTKAVRKYPFAVGDELECELYDYNQHIVCRVEVVRVVQSSSEEAEDYPCGFGVKIINIKELSNKKLKSLINKVKENKVLY